MHLPHKLLMSSDNIYIILLRNVYFRHRKCWFQRMFTNLMRYKYFQVWCQETESHKNVITRLYFCLLLYLRGKVFSITASAVYGRRPLILSTKQPIYYASMYCRLSHFKPSLPHSPLSLLKCYIKVPQRPVFITDPQSYVLLLYLYL